MAFLDRLVSDVIKKSTGYNARSFVRAVGGKNILLLGGAAVAAALAAEKMGQQQNPQQPQQPSGAVPPPPPVPSIPPPPPPPQDLVFAIVRTMVAGALADGEMHTEEKELIDKRLGESGLSLEQIQQVQRDLQSPAAPGTIAALVSSPSDKELLYRFGALVVLADGDASAPEKAWLQQLSGALGIEATRRDAIEKEIFEDSP